MTRTQNPPLLGADHVFRRIWLLIPEGYPILTGPLPGNGHKYTGSSTHGPHPQATIHHLLPTAAAKNQGEPTPSYSRLALPDSFALSLEASALSSSSSPDQKPLCTAAVVVQVNDDTNPTLQKHLPDTKLFQAAVDSSSITSSKISGGKQKEFFVLREGGHSFNLFPLRKSGIIPNKSRLRVTPLSLSSHLPKANCTAERCSPPSILRLYSVCRK